MSRPIKAAKNPTLCSLTLDVTIDGLTDPEFIEYLEANDITYHVLTWNGPAGGHPEVQFFGTHEALKNFVYDQYASGDSEQDEYIVSLIEPA